MGVESLLECIFKTLAKRIRGKKPKEMGYALGLCEPPRQDLSESFRRRARI